MPTRAERTTRMRLKRRVRFRITSSPMMPTIGCSSATVTASRPSPRPMSTWNFRPAGVSSWDIGPMRWTRAGSRGLWTTFRSLTARCRRRRFCRLPAHCTLATRRVRVGRRRRIHRYASRRGRHFGSRGPGTPSARCRARAVSNSPTGRPLSSRRSMRSPVRSPGKGRLHLPTGASSPSMRSVPTFRWRTSRALPSCRPTPLSVLPMTRRGC